jgi:transglutaminase-like putative cysteine protease
MTVGDVIRVGVDFGHPKAVESMVVRVRANERVPSEPNHEVTRGLGGTQEVTVKVGAGARVTAAERADALRVTDSIDRAAALRSAAKKAVAGARGDREKVARLIRYVYETVRYEHDDETVASKVLEDGVGDCSEKTLVFVAMARAVGVPARQVSGLAGTYDDGPAFGFHAWAQVAIDGRWQQVDPTWNETIADATHLMLGVGDGDEWARVADGILLSVVRVTRRPNAVYDSDLASLARELPMHLRVRR